jgi:RNA polymerase sigma factor FliA
MNNAILWKTFKDKQSPEIKQQIMINYTNLVHYVIHHSKFVNQSVVDEKDYFQFGIEGLSEAIDRFDPEYGTKFETYAIQRIRGKIIDELRKLQIKPRIPGLDKSQQMNFKNVSLNQPIDNEDGYMLYELIPTETQPPDDKLYKDEEKQILVKVLKRMNERDRLIITLYYYENLNYKEIADVLNITVSRVSQIHSKILKELKSSLVAEYDR